MESSSLSDNYKDFFSANSDWSGDRIVNDTFETVQFHNNSSMRIWCNEQSAGFDTHWHSALEIIMPVDNYYDAEVSQVSYHIKPDEILFILPGEMHKLTAPKTGRRFIYQFDLSMFSQIKGTSLVLALLSQQPYMTRDTYPKIYDDVCHILIRIRNEYFSQTEFAELTICSLLLHLSSLIGYNHIYQKELFPDLHITNRKEHIEKFNNLLDYINVHYAEDLNLENMASYIGFSKYHFSRLFKQYTNLTFNDYLTYRRIKAAEELLADASIPITEVSMRAGFASISTFNRLFKESKNCTPREFRSINSYGLRSNEPHIP